MATKISVRYPNELSVQPFSVWDAVSFNTVTDLTPVLSWPDKYGSGRNLTYVGTVKAPYVSEERLNGNKVVECDAVDSRLQFSPATFTGDFSFSIVVKVSGAVQTGYRILDFGFSFRFNTLTNYNLATTGGFIATNLNTPFDWSIITVTRNASTLNIYSGSNLVNTFTNSDSLYTVITVFGNPNSFAVGRFMKTYLAEINTFNYALTTKDVLMNHRYLKLKWGI